MAAYLGAAAVAAQQNRLLLGGHALGLGRDASPPFLPLQSPIGGDSPVLDFSTKRKSQDMDDMDRDLPLKNHDDDDVPMKCGDDPLDLSVSRKRTNSSPPLPPPASHGRKLSRPMDYKTSTIGSPWSSPPIASYFAGTNASTTSPSPKSHHASSHAAQHQSDWNGMKNKMSTPNDATKALEKMSELSRLGGGGGGNEMSRQQNSGSSSSNTPSTGRHSAWQSHWLNKGADSVKDVFKCVWCKQSFPTLETLTIHMKETQHLGVNMDGQRGGHNHQSQPPHNSHSNQNHAASNSSTSTSSATSKADLHLMIKETMPLPRKLVRGQDVWLGKGAEQTRQILKCMWCGQSFRSLSEMTTHMQQTQHYTNIISQEQIISWKSSDDIKGGPSSGGSANNPSSNGSNAASGNISTVSAVLTCKVCDQAFSSLKDLSNHMVKNAHYKEHIMRSISESGGRRRQTREKRKKSLPVRKLLEIERAQNEYKNGDNLPIAKSLRDSTSGRITCEKCGDKIDTNVFVEHIRQCIGSTSESNAQRNLMKNNILMPDTLPRDGRKSIGGDDSNASQSSRLMSPNLSSKEGSSTSDKTGSPSVLNAIEQLIEKSFDTRSRHVTNNFAQNSQQNTPLGSSILKRLGIDESVDYTKPLIDTQTMNLLRGFSQQSASSTYSQRERSASESSSVSDRGSSVIDTSVTPDRKTDSVNNYRNRETPDQDMDDENEALSLKIKADPEREHKAKKSTSADDASVSIKKEMTDDENDHDDKSEHASDLRTGARILSPALSSKRSNSGDEHQRTPLASPNSDMLSPRSTPEANNKKSKSAIPTNSLGALSSMFDNLASSGSSKTMESGKKSNSNPLAALQKLCDKTENSPMNKSNNSQSQQLAVPVQPNNAPSTASGAMLAFSWACNDGLINAADSAIKCAFCDTPFSSKGAYRHHLSKVHFVKDDNLLDPIIAKAQKLSNAARRTPPSQAHSPRSVSSSTSSSGNGLPNNRLSKSPTPPASSNPNNSHQSTSNASQSSTSGANFDESPHSKFLKYTELAKQLSSKYV